MDGLQKQSDHSRAHSHRQCQLVSQPDRLRLPIETIPHRTLERVRGSMLQPSSPSAVPFAGGDHGGLQETLAHAPVETEHLTVIENAVNSVPPSHKQNPI